MRYWGRVFFSYGHGGDEGNPGNFDCLGRSIIWLCMACPSLHHWLCWIVVGEFLAACLLRRGWKR